MASSPFSADSEIVLLNAPTLDDAGNLDTFLGKRTGTLASGKQRKPRYTVEIRSQPILLDLDELALGEQSAIAIRDLLADQTNGITQKASAATLAKRARSAGEYRAGLPSATARYSGTSRKGALGPMAPNQRDTLFYDSGRMAAGYFVRLNKTDKTYTVNLPANRDFGQGNLAMFERWRELHPASDPKNLSNYPVYEAALKRSVDEMIQTADSATAAKIKMLAMTRKRALRAIGSALVEVATSA